MWKGTAGQGAAAAAAAGGPEGPEPGGIKIMKKCNICAYSLLSPTARVGVCVGRERGFTADCVGSRKLQQLRAPLWALALAAARVACVGVPNACVGDGHPTALAALR